MKKTLGITLTMASMLLLTACDTDHTNDIDCADQSNRNLDECQEYQYHHSVSPGYVPHYYFWSSPGNSYRYVTPSRSTIIVTTPSTSYVSTSSVSVSRGGFGSTAIGGFSAGE